VSWSRTASSRPTARESCPRTARSTSSGLWSTARSISPSTADYDITRYQPVLYRAESLDEVREVVGGFSASCTDESIAALRERAAVAAA
jgi:hypothetical protein